MYTVIEIILYGDNVDFIITFTWGFTIYPFMEILWRGYTHPTMCFAGGIASCVIYLIAKYMTGSIFLKALYGAFSITLVELLFGIVFNIFLKLDVWDYSGLPFNFIGQICVGYFLIWYVVCFGLIYIYSKIKFVFA